MTTMKPAAGSIPASAPAVGGRVSFLHDVLGAFSPNRVISKAAFRFIIVFQIAVNVGMVVGLMPVTGIPLPLMSYGGSSILFTFLALGIIMNIRMRRFVN